MKFFTVKRYLANNGDQMNVQQTNAVCTLVRCRRRRLCRLTKCDRIEKAPCAIQDLHDYMKQTADTNMITSQQFTLC